MLVLQSRSSSSLEIVWQFRPAINMMSPAHHAQHTTMRSRVQHTGEHAHLFVRFIIALLVLRLREVQQFSEPFAVLFGNNIAELTSKEYHAHFSIGMFYLVS